ncbi:bifunctional phosphoribosylaminoimidazolecarboxamide formyltransferase/IMP cyclohydrolase [Vagococcus xieshaowenii]|uniref:Bifunctional purine biosynthesis protein PurH n=1 Tax=Vagococcus xieshaowenii TaxID=2562451 RepID=A0AAJ5EH67_9ENTE|nr:bifunctional phosphoribosylaminoimidazolecarboxamide formyltransferase/IMP cyclohydrolase [Vagococcus xieshaowenii]QCA28801.1 bifunctional phosphoribosylaminoimidazolecarboxamide formyltransferase/IMP cyclohydrolase [Vagococcus xieshaowenii]TFZ42998.1 bifunctional phosphoribosylaminoimidazolecarboxamide formyltransferase/IMP cyclohydrolase [Vagococcus xieshaowenii]
MKKRALISVSDKTGIVAFAKALVTLGFDIISTGGTKLLLDEAGISTIAIDDITGFPEMLDGRVKTLHPNIHGGLLARRDLVTHLEKVKEHQIELIDLVYVNLYPFKETLANPEATHEMIIENIDIGGPSMLRSAAKNYAAVTTLVSPNDFERVLNELKDNGETTLETREYLAAKVFGHTAYYDAMIAHYMNQKVGIATPELLVNGYELQQTLRYGENNHQAASFYRQPFTTSGSLVNATQLNGKELSYNNLRDADAAVRIIQDFDQPTVAVLKHMNPCGIGTGQTIEAAFVSAYEADPVSIFGGIVVLNREVDLATAEHLHKIFLEIIIAPSYSSEALDLLRKKKNLRVLSLDLTRLKTNHEPMEVTSVLGGVLVQELDSITGDDEVWEVVTKRQPTEEEVAALAFAWKAVKHVKSNAIVISNDTRTLGVGAGQMNRIGSLKIAMEQASDNLDGVVVGSDAFFPMSDSIEYLASHGIKAVIQPGGSIKDNEVIVAADEHDIAMIFTGTRHFKH